MGDPMNTINERMVQIVLYLSNLQIRGFLYGYQARKLASLLLRVCSFDAQPAVD